MRVQLLGGDGYLGRPTGLHHSGGTPTIDSAEDSIEITHRGRTGVLPFPKQPGRFHCLSTVHDGHTMPSAAVPGVCVRPTSTRASCTASRPVRHMAPRPCRHDSTATPFFGTTLNRFVIEAAADVPLTVYGNQFTESFSVGQLAQKVSEASCGAPIVHLGAHGSSSRSTRTGPRTPSCSISV